MVSKRKYSLKKLIKIARQNRMLLAELQYMGQNSGRLPAPPYTWKELLPGDWSVGKKPPKISQPKKDKSNG